ncbi:MAG: hypothetical protein ACK5Q5_22460 [Planctomycetaceae bacterium]
MSLKHLIQAVLLLTSGLFAGDIKNTGIDVDSLPFWGNLFTALAGVGLTFGLTKDRFVELVTFGKSIAKKWNESDLPNGCTARMNSFVAALQAGIAPEAIRPLYDAEWATIVRETVQTVPTSQPHA